MQTYLFVFGDVYERRSKVCLVLFFEFFVDVSHNMFEVFITRDQNTRRRPTSFMAIAYWATVGLYVNVKQDFRGKDHLVLLTIHGII